MDQRLTPEFFCGSAIAALGGLLFGLLLHVSWQKNPGGPQILAGSAQAAEPARRSVEDIATDVSMPEPAQAADLDVGYAPPAPLPVTRLKPEMFEVQPAAADEAEREDVDGLAADAAPQAPSRNLD